MDIKFLFKQIYQWIDKLFNGGLISIKVHQSVKDCIPVFRDFTHLKPKVLVEIGANLAKDCNYLAGQLGIDHENCYVIEAHPQLFQKIKQRYPNMNSFNMAIWTESGEKIFNAVNLREQPNHGISSLLEDKCHDSRLFDKVTVPTLTAREFMKNNNIDIIDILKIDVEGATYEVLESFFERLKDVVLIQIEAEHIPCWKGQHCYNDIENLLEKNKFVLIKFQRGGVQSDSIWLNSQFSNRHL